MKKPRVLSVVGWLLIAAVAAFFLLRYMDAQRYEAQLEAYALDVLTQVQAIPAEELEYAARYIPHDFREMPNRAIATPGRENEVGDWEYILKAPDEELDTAVRKLIETMMLSSFESRETPPTTGEETLEITFFDGQGSSFTFHPRTNIQLEYRTRMEDGNLLYIQYAVDREALLTLCNALGTWLQVPAVE